MLRNERFVVIIVFETVRDATEVLVPDNTFVVRDMFDGSGGDK